MKKIIKTATALILPALLSLTGCIKDHDIDQMKTFKVEIENVSTPGLLPTMRAMGTVPLSPPVYAVYGSGSPMFMLDQPANLGTERIAEDGFPEEMVKLLSGIPTVTASGALPSPGGPDDGPALFAGEKVMFTFTAKPGDKLQFETMFVQSNDWFISFKNGGLSLFNGNLPVSGDKSSELEIYDAGTEEDTAPGTGPNQKPVQDPAATNVGPDDSVKKITIARNRHTQFNIPSTGSVIKLTITPQ